MPENKQRLDKELDNIVDVLYEQHAVFNEEDFRSWLYDYGYEMARYAGMNPHKALIYIKRQMNEMSTAIQECVTQLYQNNPTQWYNLSTCIHQDPENIARSKYGGGVPPQ